jgi:hypothetical protein
MSVFSKAGTAGGRTLCWVAVSIALCLALFGTGATFETDDDPAMEGLLSGRAYGCSFDAVFLGHNLSSLLMRCYGALPGVPWYGLFLETVTMISTVLWTLLIVRRLRNPLHTAAALAGFFAVHQYLLLRLNFMGTALSLFLAAAAWLAKLQVEGGPLRLRQGWIGLAMGLSYMIRPTLGQLVLFFGAPCLALSLNRRAAARLAYVAAVAGVIVIWTGQAERGWLETPANRLYAEFNAVRGAFVDRPHTCTREALHAAGWSHTDYRAAMQSWFYDEDLFSVARFQRFLLAAGRGEAMATRLRTACGHLLKPYHLLCLAVLLFCPAFLWLDRACGDGPSRPVPLLVPFGVWAWLLLGVLLLMAYRFPPRAYVPIYTYMAVLALWVPLPLFRASPPRTPPRWARVPAVAAMAGLMVFVAVFRAGAAREARERDLLHERDFASSVLSRFDEETLFVPLSPLWSDASRSVFAPPDGQRFSFLSSGWLLRSPAYYRLLGEFGYDSGHRLLERASTDPRVVFVVHRGEEDRAVHVQRHMNQHVPAGDGLRFEEVARSSEGIFVFYRLRR